VTSATERIDAYWSRFLGVPEAALRCLGVTVTAHAALGDYRGVWLFVRGECGVVSAPPEWVEPFAREYASTPADALLDAERARRVLGPFAGTAVGPSFQGWLPPEALRAVPEDGVCRIADGGVELVASLRAACAPQEWEHGGVGDGAGELWASFAGRELAALGRMRARDGDAVDPCVIAHPAHRGRGHALRLVGAMVRDALASGRLVLYQTLLANAPALSVARRLGFEPYATLLAVRLVAR